MSIEIYGRDGQPMSMAEFNEKLGDLEYKRVASTDIGPYWVSTVWLGLDHRWSSDGPPIIFETMVFSKDQRDDEDDRGLIDIDCQRYCTEEQAQAGHEEMVTLIRATLQEVPDEPQNGAQKP